MKQLKLILLFLCFSITVNAQYIIQRDTMYTYSVPETTADQVGIDQPYKIAYVWQYSYLNKKGGIQHSYQIRIGEKNNSFTLHRKVLDLSCTVTSFHMLGNYITGLKYREYHYYFNDIENIEPLDTIPQKVKKQ